MFIEFFILQSELIDRQSLFLWNKRLGVYIGLII